MKEWLKKLKKWQKLINLNEEADVRNNASSLIFQTEQAMEDLKEDLDEKTKEKLEGKIKDLNDALAGTDVETIKNKMSDLEKDAQEIAMKAYEKTQKQETNGEAQSEEEPASDDTIDASFEEKSIKCKG